METRPLESVFSAEGDLDESIAQFGPSVELGRHCWERSADQGLSAG